MCIATLQCIRFCNSASHWQLRYKENFTLGFSVSYTVSILHRVLSIRRNHSLWILLLSFTKAKTLPQSNRSIFLLLCRLMTFKCSDQTKEYLKHIRLISVAIFEYLKQSESSPGLSGSVVCFRISLFDGIMLSAYYTTWNLYPNFYLQSQKLKFILVIIHLCVVFCCFFGEKQWIDRLQTEKIKL